jgi:VWFA-related protein
MKRLAWLLILSLNLHAFGQESQDVVRISTNLVQVDVVVTKDGRQVADLKPEDFEILEDGRRQQITNFAFFSVKSSSTKPTPATPSDSPALTPPTPRPYEIRRTVAIVVDDLGMSFQSMADLRTYLRKFISEKLTPNDLVAIIRTGGEVGAFQQFTTDPRVLSNAIADLKWNPCSRVGTSVLTPERSLITMVPPEQQLRGRLPPDRSPTSAQVDRPNTANESNACSVNNSVNYSISAIRFILRGMRDLPGRKSMMLISDNLPLQRQEGAPVDFGFKRPVRENANVIDVWTQSTSYADGLHGLAEQAIRSSVVIYGVSAQGLQTVGPSASDEISFPPQQMTRSMRPDQSNPLSRLMSSRSAELRRNIDGTEVLAKETGGFLIRNKNDFGLDRVLEDQNGYYLIGYRPATDTFNRRQHAIQVRVKRGGYNVRTRAGFYGATEDPGGAAVLQADPLNKALSSPFGANELTVRMASLFANDPVRGSLLRTFVAVDAKDLTFTEEPDGAHVAKLDISSVLFAGNGAMVSRQDQSAMLRLRGRPYERALREGVVYGIDLPLRQAGAFQLRVAVRDSASQKIGAAGQFIQAPNLSDGQLALSDILLYAEGANATASVSDEMQTSLVLRRFHQGASLVFGYTIYNAALDKKTHAPRLTTQTVVFRDSVKIYSSDQLPVTATDQTDLKRIATGARLQLGPALTAGEYVVQIVVADQIAKRTVTQVTQFEVVK